MHKYKLNLIQRKTLYDSYDHKCFFCDELIIFKDLNIDHIIPEKFLSNKDDLKKYLKKIGLKESFEINSYNNWVPCCRKCNLEKGGNLYNKNTILHYLEVIKNKVPKIILLEEKIKKRLEKEKWNLTVSVALENGKISVSEINQLMNNHKVNSEIKFRISSEIEFVNRIFREWITQDDLYELLLLPVKTGSQEDEGVYLTDPKNDNEKINVKNCKDYSYYTEKGYYPYTTIDIKIAASFEKICGVVQALKKATIPSFTSISDLNISVNNFELLPLHFFCSIDPDIRNLINKNVELSFQDWIDTGYFKVIEKMENGFHIIEGRSEGFIMFELMRADLNNDDKEDILVFCYSYVIGGTAGFGYTTKLSLEIKDGIRKFVEIS
ncbi:MAG: HNH endonuclease signature motif containing protein [Candidatus Margulisiibacteriota bacterium]|jgi:5-methylcytosine-specific restriction endonuclease McrA